MILISHRGNLGGKQLNNENNPNYILRALTAGYNVEIAISTLYPAVKALKI